MEGANLIGRDYSVNCDTPSNETEAHALLFTMIPQTSAFRPQKERWRAGEEVECAKREHRGFWGSVNTEKLFVFGLWSQNIQWTKDAFQWGFNGGSVICCSFHRAGAVTESDLSKCLYTNLDYWWPSDDDQHFYFLYFIYFLFSITNYCVWCQIDFLFLHSCFKTEPLLATILVAKYVYSYLSTSFVMTLEFLFLLQYIEIYHQRRKRFSTNGTS